MTFESSLFITYSACPRTRKVVTADGSLATVAGIGDVQINSSLTLKNVHVPKLSTNLYLFTNLLMIYYFDIYSQTHDLCCRVAFGRRTPGRRLDVLRSKIVSITSNCQAITIKIRLSTWLKNHSTMKENFGSIIID